MCIGFSTRKWTEFGSLNLIIVIFAINISKIKKTYRHLLIMKRTTYLGQWCLNPFQCHPLVPYTFITASLPVSKYLQSLLSGLLSSISSQSHPQFEISFSMSIFKFSHKGKLYV